MSFQRTRFVYTLRLLVFGVGSALLLSGGDRISLAAGDRAEPSSPRDTEATDVPALPTEVHAVELATVGFDTLTQAPIVLLREPESGTVVPIWVGLAEARAIARALDGYEPPRPMTHDLMTSLLKEMNAELVDVVVDDLRNHTYHGKLKLRVAGEKELRIVDTRPSDGLALALRTGATIHVADKIIQNSPKFDFLPQDESKQVVHALGITVVKPSAAHRAEFKLPDREGVVVTQVTGLAKRRGVQRGDLIVRVNGQTPSAPMEFFDTVRAVPAGSTVQVIYLRDGKEHTVKLPADVPAPEPTKNPGGPGTIKV